MGKAINIFEDGKESRDFVFIDDVVAATFAGLINESANGEVFNVGTGSPTDINTVAATLIKGYDVEVPVAISGNYRLGDIRHNFASIDKINANLGFKPQFDFEAGILKFIDWVKGQEIHSLNYKQSIEEMENKGLLRVSK
jgi:dTDP-L-rhamnose 4-epimerase